MLSAVPRAYPLLGMLAGYLVIMFTSPVRIALRDGLRCVLRFRRLWLCFALFGFAYAIFQFVVFTPFGPTPDLHVAQFAFWETWHWPGLGAVWRESLLRAAEAVAGIFDAAATTFPLSVVAALLLLCNWRGLHASLVRALRKQFGLAGWLIYLGVLLSALASLVKPFIYWRVPSWMQMVAPAPLLQASAVVDTIAFVFEYLCAVYLQVYLITVCLAWIKGLHFGEEALLRFAMRRFSFVLKWLGCVVLASTLFLRLPLLVAYFREIPGVLDYLPLGRCFMTALIISFGTMQISLTLHNETLREAFRAHRKFLRKHAWRFGWFLLLLLIHYWFLAFADTTVHAAAAERPLALILWQLLFLLARALVTGWLLASWVCLYRQCEIGQLNRETWIRY